MPLVVFANLERTRRRRDETELSRTLSLAIESNLARFIAHLFPSIRRRIIGRENHSQRAIKTDVRGIVERSGGQRFVVIDHLECLTVESFLVQTTIHRDVSEVEIGSGKLWCDGDFFQHIQVAISYCDVPLTVIRWLGSHLQIHRLTLCHHRRLVARLGIA